MLSIGICWPLSVCGRFLGLDGLWYLDVRELCVNSGVERFKVGVWWYYTLFENHDSLNQTCNATRAFQMADISLEGAASMCVSAHANNGRDLS